MAGVYMGGYYNDNDDEDYNYMNFWDPMAMDYNDPNFNSYTRGPGVQLESQLALGERRAVHKDGIKLYVKNVPRDMSQDMFKNIFSRCGNVTSAFLGKPKGAFNIGFVTYNTLREAQNAIENISDAPPFLLKVQFSEDDSQKQIRQKNRSSFYGANSLPPLMQAPPVHKKLGIGRGISRDVNHQRFNGFGVNPQNIRAEYYRPYSNYSEYSDGDYEEGHFNPYDGGPYDSTHKIISPLIQVDGTGRKVTQGRGFIRLDRNDVNYKARLHSKERNEKLRNAIGPYVMETIKVFDNQTKVSVPHNYVREKCKTCSALTSSLCSGCDSQFYCSRDCQVKDWPKHKNNCSKLLTPQEKSSRHTNNKADGAVASYKPRESNFTQNDGYHSKKDDSKKPFFKKGDRNESNGRQNKFQNRRFDDKGKHGSSGQQSNMYQRPNTRLEDNDEDWNVKPSGDDSAFNKEQAVSSPDKKRTVADSITESSLHSGMVEPVSSPAGPAREQTPLTPAVSVPSDSYIVPPTPTRTLLLQSESSTVSQSPTSKVAFFVTNVPVEVIKQHMLSENDCYVVKKDDVLKFGELFENLNRVMTDSSPSVTNVSISMKCAAKYEDSWFRAKVVCTDPLKILFVDYGNEESVSDPSELKVLPEQFRSTAPFAARIYYKDGSKGVKWEVESASTVIPISKESDGRWLVRFPSTVDQSSGPKSMSETNLADNSIVNQARSDSVSNKPSINDVSTFNDAGASGSFKKTEVPSKEGVPSNYKPKELDLSLGLFKDVERTWKGCSIVDDITLDSTLLLKVQEVVDDRIIIASAFCKTLPYIAKLYTVCGECLPDQPLDPDFRPVCGDMVGVYFADDEWTRAVVNSISSDGSYNLIFVDKGFKKNSVKLMKKLPYDSASYPRLAVKVTAHTDLKGCVTAGSTVTFALKEEVDGGWIGKIKKKEDGKGIAQKEEEITSGHLEPWEPEFTDENPLTCLKLEPGASVIISGGHDAKNIYVKVVTPEFVDLYESLAQDVNASVLTGEHLAKEPQLGDFLAAKWDVDDNYYRAQVIKKEKGCYKVIFVDFGNIATVRFEDMVVLSPTLRNQPCCAIKIGLVDVPMKPFTASAVEYINSLSDNEEMLTVEFEKLSAVKLMQRDKTVINEKLAELMVPGWLKANAKGSDPTGGQVLRRNMLPHLAPYPENETVQLAYLNVVPPFSGEHVQFVFCDDKTDAFKHMIGPLTDQLVEYQKSLPTDDKYVPRTGELCIAKFAEDGCYYRAECIKALEYCAKVFFIDYGNVGDVPFNDIHKLPADMMLTPAVGIICSAIDILYSEKVFNAILSSFDLGKIYSVKILKKKDDEYDVVIPEISEDLKAQGVI